MLKQIVKVDGMMCGMCEAHVSDAVRIALLAPVTLFLILCRVSMKASVVLLVCVPLIPVSIVAVQKIAKRLLNKYWSIYTGLGDATQLHQCDGYRGLRRCGDWYGGGGIRFSARESAFVRHNSYLFKGTVEENLRMAKPDATEREMRDVLSKVNLLDFLENHDAPLLLLDETTSNLDSLNEGIILKSLKETAGKKTVVLVSHRASTMHVADEVYEMEGGRSDCK